MKRFADPFPILCGVCRRQAEGLAIGSIESFKGGAPKPRLWICDDPTCASSAYRVMKMPTPDLNALEGWALSDAGDAAGRYLEGLGKTDLGDLSPAEWSRFLKTVLTTYESQMRALVSERLGKAAR